MGAALAAVTVAATTTEAIIGTGAITLLTIAISFTGAAAKRARAENQECRHENALCNWRQTVLVEVMHNAGMPVPSWLWSETPVNVAKMSPEEQRTMAQQMLDPFGGDEPA
jgi:hypothetical protein